MPVYQSAFEIHTIVFCKLPGGIPYSYLYDYNREYNELVFLMKISKPSINKECRVGCISISNFYSSSLYFICIQTYQKCHNGCSTPTCSNERTCFKNMFPLIYITNN